MRILITGGAGFIGSHLAERLLRDQHEVWIVDNLFSGHRENLCNIESRIQFVEGDIRDPALIERLAKGCDLIFHQAAIVSVPYSIEHPQESHDVNIQGTINVLMAALHQKVKRVVFACSCAIYGDDPVLPKTEDMAARPISPYAVEKLAGENYLSVFSKLYGLETVSLRYFNVFGPRQDPTSPYSGVISIFVNRLLANKTPTIFGDGEQSRDFVFVENVVEANVLAALAPNASGRCYNIGCGQKTTLNALVSLLSAAADHPFSAQYAPARPGDIRDSCADISRAQSELGYQPHILVDQGLKRLLDDERRRVSQL